MDNKQHFWLSVKAKRIDYVHPIDKMPLQAPSHRTMYTYLKYKPIKNSCVYVGAILFNPDDLILYVGYNYEIESLQRIPEFNKWECQFNLKEYISYLWQMFFLKFYNVPITPFEAKNIFTNEIVDSNKIKNNKIFNTRITELPFTGTYDHKQNFLDLLENVNYKPIEGADNAENSN